jgi:hypothetical protein
MRQKDWIIAKKVVSPGSAAMGGLEEQKIQKSFSFFWNINFQAN